MTLDEFKASLADTRLPTALSPALQALWHAGQNDWHAAHGIAQDDPGRDAAWVHAHLHRQEGDLANADYWYRRAGRSRPDTSLKVEWEAIGAELLARG